MFNQRVVQRLVEILSVSIVLAVLIAGDLTTRLNAVAAPAETTRDAASAPVVAAQDSQRVLVIKFNGEMIPN